MEDILIQNITENVKIAVSTAMAKVAVKTAFHFSNNSTLKMEDILKSVDEQIGNDQYFQALCPALTLKVEALWSERRKVLVIDYEGNPEGSKEAVTCQTLAEAEEIFREKASRYIRLLEAIIQSEQS